METIKVKILKISNGYVIEMSDGTKVFESNAPDAVLKIMRDFTNGIISMDMGQEVSSEVNYEVTKN